MGRHIWTHLGDVVHVPGGGGSGGGGGGGGGDGIGAIVVGIVLVVAVIWLIAWAFSSWENIVIVVVLAMVAKKAMA